MGMTATQKLIELSRVIETQMQAYQQQIEEIMEEAEENEEEIDIEQRGMYVNMVEVMQEVAPECPCFYDVINKTATAPYDERSSLDFFFDSVHDQLQDEIG